MGKSIKKILCSIMVVFMVLNSVPLGGLMTNAESGVGDIGSREEFTIIGQCGDDIYWNYDEESGVLTICGTGDMWDYYYNWSPFLKGNVKSVIIKDGVTSIGKYAFHDCSTITSIEIPESVKSINEYAFYSCRALTSISIPKFVTNIGEGALLNCRSLDSITVDTNNTKYSSDSYGVLFSKDKTELIQYPIGNKRISYSIPNSVTSIGNEAFQYCELTSIENTCYVKKIGKEAFSNCSNFSEVAFENIEHIGEKAFFWCNELDTILIPDSVISIGKQAFSYTDYYSNADNWIDGILYLGKSLIEVNDEVVQCDLSSDLINISDDAFDDCINLENINIDESNEYYSSIDGVLFNKDKTELVRYPMGKAQTAYNIPNTVAKIQDYAFYWATNLANLTIPDSVTYIGDYTFSGCSNLNSVTIPDGVTRVGESVFDGCESLKSVTINDNVTSIGNGAFWGCNSLPSITIPDSVTSIGDYAFYACIKLTSIIIPNSVTTIGDTAFGWCTNLANVSIGSNVTNIGDDVFSSCRKLTGITVDSNNKKYSSDSDGVLFNKGKTELIQYPLGNDRTSYSIPDSVISIGRNAFWRCNNLTSVIIPDSVISIGSNAFWDCNNLTSIIIPDSVTSIGDSAFLDCNSLTSITVDINNAKYSSDSYGVLFNKDKTELIQYPASNKRISYSIPKSVTRIDEYAFWYCSSLANITIPDGVTSIMNNTFSGCNNLIFIIIPDNVTNIGTAAFNGCTSLTSVTIPESVISIGNYAFSDCSAMSDLYYKGTQTAWETISIGYNNKFTSATIHFIGDDSSHIHTLEAITIPATCTVDGMTYQVCSECGEPVGTSTVILATHTPGDWEVTIEPTDELEGKRVKKCTVCGAKLQEESIQKLAKASAIDEKTGVTIEYSNNNYSGTVDMSVNETSDNSAYLLIDTIGATSSKIYDITLTVDGEETQPNGKVTVKIPLPSDYNPDYSYVYHVNTETGAVEKMSASYIDGYMVFETDHFSYYAVIEIHQHTFNGSKCTTCGYDRSDDCSCNCHKSGIAHFFFVIVNFFQKLFGNNKTCDCGAKH